ncbi:MAG: preprotein translocase subunit YajC [Parvularcula sp.]|jgi:preprotein translocase subunit YajC|nr:preprotein translocase subunit YajC [Parvularcula sp.]
MPFTVLISTAAAQTPAGPSGPGAIIAQLIPFILIFVVFYFLLIRPQQQARKKHEAKIAAVKRGDTVVTAGGIVGKVKRVSDDPELLVEIADGVEIKVMKHTLADIRSRTEAAKPASAKPAND